jgi:hypothetical protein
MTVACDGLSGHICPRRPGAGGEGSVATRRKALQSVSIGSGGLIVEPPTTIRLALAA